MRYLGVFIGPLKMPPAVALNQAEQRGCRELWGQQRAGLVLSEALPQREPFCCSVIVLLPPGSVIHRCLPVPQSPKTNSKLSVPP
jgi:hypothetical protein